MPTVTLSIFRRNYGSVLRPWLVLYFGLQQYPYQAVTAVKHDQVITSRVRLLTACAGSAHKLTSLRTKSKIDSFGPEIWCGDWEWPQNLAHEDEMLK